MLDWIKNINKEYPEFWKSYLSKFEKKPTRYVVLSTETTGLNPTKDVILSFGAIAVINDSIIIGYQNHSNRTILFKHTVYPVHGSHNGSHG